MINRKTTLLLSLAALFAASSCQKANDKKEDKQDQGAKDPGASRPQKDSKGPKPGDIPAPPDVAAPPADAKKTESGLSYKVLTPAPTPGEKPTEEDTVEVHYTGWTTDGKMFDSSVRRGKPAKFGLGQVIAGWTEGVQLMSPGEKTRFWIPEDLAYKGSAGAPAGMLVFDIELLKVYSVPKAPEDVAAPPEDTKKTKLGVSYRVLKEPTGDKSPRAHDKVSVHYTGWTTDGKMFDSSVTRGAPAQFSVNGVIPGWTDVLQEMKVGESRRIWIPKEHAYNDAPGRPAGMLVFDVELLEVMEMPEPPPVPEDVAAPPKNAKKTEKGVFYKVLKKGDGTKSPTEKDRVEVHYSGWTTDGKMFDSSVTRGKTITFSLTGVIPGWTDGLQVMKEGDKTRFWIPEELAYKGKQGRPQGMLVFDVELIAVK